MGPPPVTRPAGHDSSAFVVSVSGGKDSTATVLALREADVPARYVFADTGWEVPPVYEYLVTLERALGITIARVASAGFAALAVRHGIFPRSTAAWCTRDLKVRPLRAYHTALAEREDCDTVSVVGIRAEESPRRAALPEGCVYDDAWKGYVWRPILRWTVADVLAIHHRHGVPVNPLYRLGFSRVGCAPCRNAARADLRLWAEHFPERIAALRDLERAVSEERARRGHADSAALYTQHTGGPVGIDDVVAWARANRGGKQLPLIREDPDGGCYRWGLCDAPSAPRER